MEILDNSLGFFAYVPKLNYFHNEVNYFEDAKDIEEDKENDLEDEDNYDKNGKEEEEWEDNKEVIKKMINILLLKKKFWKL